MIKILFVCHGNICRSPMAEFVMKKLVREAGLEKRFVIASAATSTEELGNPVYFPARRKLAKHGIDCAGKQAVQLKRADYAKYDLIVGMDRWNIRNILRIVGSDPANKVRLLLPGREVDDPWYTGDFDVAYADILEGCTALLSELSKKAGS